MRSHQLLYLSRNDVEAVALDMKTLIDLLDAAFKEKGAGRVEMPPKPGLHTRPDAFIHAMPAFIPALGAAGMKWVSGYPENHTRGLPYISGLLILNDTATGIPSVVMDCTWITASRTAAASALAARYLARAGSRTLGILACGVQGRTNLQAIATLFPIERVYAYDVLPDAQRRFVAEMNASTGIDIIGVDHPKKAVEVSDIVVTSGPILKRPSPVIQKDWLRAGAFAAALDFDSYWTGDALKQVDKLVTDDLAQYKYYQNVGYFQQTPDPSADLGEIVTGGKPGREREDERTMAMNLGLALEDMAVAVEIDRRARERGIGTWLSL
ncbi:MAG: hypothetical protein HYX75_16370 [Acidobacteria bacterium]|nr:hypothetical protein [Acidobacteriota bacterium]